MARTERPRARPPSSPSPPEGGGGQKKGAGFLTKKVGPLPLWVWLAAGAVIVYYYESTKSSATAAAATTPGTNTGYSGSGSGQTPPWLYSGFGGSGGGSGGGSSTNGTSTTTPAAGATTNNYYYGSQAPAAAAAPLQQQTPLVIDLTTPGAASPGNSGGNAAPALSPGNTSTGYTGSLGALQQAVAYDLSPMGVTTQEQAQVSAAINNLQSGQPLSATQQTALQTFANVQGHPVATGPAPVAPKPPPAPVPAKPPPAPAKAPAPGATVAKTLTPSQAQVTANVQGHAISPYAVK